MLSRIAVFRRSCLIRQFSSSDTSLVIDYRELPDVMQSHLPISPQRIRNFSIIAHIDHGKSTLADRLLETCGNISAEQRVRAQHLDTLQVERERGITVKAQTATMLTLGPGMEANEPYLLNLIDTPGHVDFSFEVNRSLTACEGVLLLVDASQGVQAQTLATFHAARHRGLAIVPVLTKIDVPAADVEERSLELAMLLDIDPESIILTSAKRGTGIRDVLTAIIERIPPPPGNTSAREALLNCSLLDSVYDEYRGIVCHVKVNDGALSTGDKITCAATRADYTVQEVGILLPHRLPVSSLSNGQVGYMIAGMKTTREAKVGDTIHRLGSPVNALTPLQEPKRMVYASIYPMDESTFAGLRDSIQRLLLTDASVSTSPESSSALGMGFRCGFLGILHMEVFLQRLHDEENIDAILTSPMVPYWIVPVSGKPYIVETPEEFPNPSRDHRVKEPMVEILIISPVEYLGNIISLLQDRRGRQVDVRYVDDSKVTLRYHVPWQEVVTDFYDELKSLTSGYATLNYTEIEPNFADIVKADILLNGQPLDALALICHRSQAQIRGRKICEKLMKVIDRQQYEISIQAALGSKIFAKTRIPPYRKNVLVKSGKSVGGGDVTRKQKLLAKQRAGKKKLMKTVRNVQLPQKAFWSVLSR